MSDNDIHARLVKYFKRLAELADEILTNDQKLQYCLIFGNRVIASANTRAEIDDISNSRFSHMLCVVYCPPQHLADDEEGTES